MIDQLHMLILQILQLMIYTWYNLGAEFAFAYEE